LDIADLHNREEVIELPMDHNGVPLLHVCPIRHISSPNEVEETKVQVDYKEFSSKE